VTSAQRHAATVASLQASIRFWEQRGMSIPAARASAMLARVESLASDEEQA
jgi:hypothetical protein